MQAIKRTSDNVVIFIGAALTLTASGASNGDWTHAGTTTGSFTLVDAVTPPSDWQGEHYTLAGTTWTRTEQGEEAHASALAAGRASAWERIKGHRDNLSDNGGYKVAVNGIDKWFHSDAKSKTQQIGLVLAGANANGIAWKTMDGTFVTMSQQLAGQIFGAAMAMEQAIFAVAEQHRASMVASASPENYDFSGGWPSTFGG